jgi:hypothetical protein
MLPRSPAPFFCRRTKAAELMAVDALMAADHALHFSRKIHGVEVRWELRGGDLRDG